MASFSSVLGTPHAQGQFRRYRCSRLPNLEPLRVHVCHAAWSQACMRRRRALLKVRLRFASQCLHASDYQEAVPCRAERNLHRLESV
jgi:hypothetical protein